MRRVLSLLLVFASLGSSAQQGKAVVDSFEVVWRTLRDHYWDAQMGGTNWQKLHDEYLPKVKGANTIDQARKAMDELIHKLPSSHLALIPSEMYETDEQSEAPSDEKLRHDFGGPASAGISVAFIEHKVVVEFSDNPAVRPGWAIQSVDGEEIQRLLKLAGERNAALVPEIVSAWLSGEAGSRTHVVFDEGDGHEMALDLERSLNHGKIVQFGNMPPELVIVRHRKLASGVGYIRLNIFLDPVSVMPEFQAAIAEFRSAPGIILDLRGNPGGLGIMAMGLAGWFVDDEGQILGTMVGRTGETQFEINPRAEPYAGKLAILVDGGSASTSEVLAQGMKDLGRARIFGSKTAGAALLSEVIQLPDGDRFQYPEANYTSFKGRVLEGHGVEPDVLAMPTIAGLLSGHDAALESAESWCMAK